MPQKWSKWDYWIGCGNTAMECFEASDTMSLDLLIRVKADVSSNSKEQSGLEKYEADL